MGNKQHIQQLKGLHAKQYIETKKFKKGKRYVQNVAHPLML